MRAKVITKFSTEAMEKALNSCFIELEKQNKHVIDVKPMHHIEKSSDFVTFTAIVLYE
jgi:hypothetical protein